MVKQQVETQIKVRDMSGAQVSIHPADYGSWGACRTELMVNAKRPIKAKMNSALALAPDDQHQAIRAQYSTKETDLEMKIDYDPMEVHMTLDVSYNFLAT